MPSDEFDYHHVLLNKEIVSAITTCWAIRLTVNTFDRTKEIYLIGPISYQRFHHVLGNPVDHARPEHGDLPQRADLLPACHLMS